MLPLALQKIKMSGASGTSGGSLTATAERQVGDTDDCPSWLEQLHEKEDHDDSSGAGSPEDEAMLASLEAVGAAHNASLFNLGCLAHAAAQDASHRVLRWYHQTQVASAFAQAYVQNAAATTDLATVDALIDKYKREEEVVRRRLSVWPPCGLA